MDRVTLGSLETVEFPECPGVSTLAKVDTGAWGCSLHCEDVYIEAGKLHYRPLSAKSASVTTTDFATKVVKSSSGNSEERFAVTMPIIVQGKQYTTIVTLSDRTPMRRDMLIGRKFLIENDMLVDVTLTIDQDDEAREEG